MATMTKKKSKKNEVVKAAVSVKSNDTQSPPPRVLPPGVSPVLSEVVAQLRELQRQRSVTIKFRIVQENRIRSVIAGTIGYSNQMPEKERERLYKEAQKLIDNVAAGKTVHPYRGIILASQDAINAFKLLEDGFSEEMVIRAALFPVAKWVEKAEQRSFGLLSLATIIGECGDLNYYANPAKLWRRMSCAPWTFNDLTRMGAAWRGKYKDVTTKLPDTEWTKYGYSPRRRSISYNIGVNIVRQNFLDNGKEEEEERKQGPYRARYLQAKERAAEKHPEWTPMHCNRHAMLLATKLLYKNLWLEWTEHKLGKPWTPEDKIAGRSLYT